MFQEQVQSTTINFYPNKKFIIKNTNNILNFKGTIHKKSLYIIFKCFQIFIIGRRLLDIFLYFRDIRKKPEISPKIT